MMQRIACSFDRSPARAQQGSVLIVSLVLLLIITILGVANMRTSTMELKMASSAKDRSLAFEAAEAALAVAQNNLSGVTGIPPGMNDFYSSCTGSTCYKPDCANGLCFDGAYDVTDLYRYDCQVAANAGTTERINFWSDTTLDVWNTAGRHVVAPPVESMDTDAKYIVEFLCFVQDPTNIAVTFSSDPTTDYVGKPLFRITAYAEGNTGSQVMLQSTYIVYQGF